MISAIFTALTTIGSSLLTWLTAIFGGIGGLFYDGTAGELTIFGIVLLLGFAMAVVWGVIKLITHFFRFKQ